MPHTCRTPYRRVPGISYDAHHDRWRAYISPTCGERKFVYFPCRRYGFLGAFERARAWRRRWERRLRK